MSFRRRNVGLSSPSSSDAEGSSASLAAAPPGLRASPLDGRRTTSTGTQTLDNVLAGHAGLPLGHNLLIEETGTTDFAGALLRFYASEGILQGHQVHVVGLPEQWGRDLPGLVESQGSKRTKDNTPGNLTGERMKIAWRYERLGESGTSSRASSTPIGQSVNPNSGMPEAAIASPFCHTFDLTKRLTLTPSGSIHHIPVSSVGGSSSSPFSSIMAHLSKAMQTSQPSTIHRILIPSLLSPALYPPDACNPTIILPFLHTLCSLLRRYPQQLTAMITLPLSLYPRSTGLVRWMEHVCDGVLELAPFPYSVDVEPPLTVSKSAPAGSANAKAEEKPQGLVRVHKLPVLTEKGGGSGAGDDMAFSLGRREFSIGKYHLPPVEGDNEAQHGEAEGGAVTVKDIEF